MRDLAWGRSVAAARRWEWRRVRDLATEDLWAEWRAKVSVLLNTERLLGDSPELRWHVRLMLGELMWRGELSRN